MASELSDMHLADLHERAATAGISGYRLMRRPELIEALEAGGGAETTTDSPDEERAPRRRLRSRGGRGRARSSRSREREVLPPETTTDEADTDELVITATVLDDSDESAVELGAGGAEEGDERGNETATDEVRGVLEVTRQRYGFLRLGGLTQSDGDVYISAAQVRRCDLRPGDEVSGPAREPRRGERHRALVHVDSVNGEEPQIEEGRPDFEALAPVQPERRIGLDAASDDVLTRAADLLAPFAYGQRVLVRAAAGSGRTTLLRSVAHAAAADGDTTRVIVLLLDERPEEATAWREAVPTAEFAIATGDLAPAEQVRTAELALERSRRLAESGLDAVLVCDSLSRLTVAAGDVAEVKRVFGSGRNLSGGGSLTVIATVLEDGRDEGETERAVLTTESSAIVLDPELASLGITPAISVPGCRVANEDQIREAAELEAARKLRSLLADLDPKEASALLRERIESTKSNAELLAAL